MVAAVDSSDGAEAVAADGCCWYCFSVAEEWTPPSAVESAFFEADEMCWRPWVEAGLCLSRTPSRTLRERNVHARKNFILQSHMFNLHYSTRISLEARFHIRNVTLIEPCVYTVKSHKYDPRIARDRFGAVQEMSVSLERWEKYVGN